MIFLHWLPTYVDGEKLHNHFDLPAKTTNSSSFYLVKKQENKFNLVFHKANCHVSFRFLINKFIWKKTILMWPFMCGVFAESF
jgi:hypothetical protein